MKRLVHLSDMHFGEQYKGKKIFREDVWEQVVNEINEINPDIIIISGDITADGYENEYRMTREYLKKIKVPILKDQNDKPDTVKQLDRFDSPLFIVPGNHDARHGSLEPDIEYLRKLSNAYKDCMNNSKSSLKIKKEQEDKVFVEKFKSLILEHYSNCGGLMAFEKYIGKLQKIYNGKGFYIVGVNTSGIGEDMDQDNDVDVDDLKAAKSLGLVGVETYPWIKENIRKADPDDFKIMVMHHHLIGIPATGNDDNVLMDSGDILKLLSDEGVDLVLNGHKHNPWFWNLNGIPILDGGTACSTSTPCENNYNLIEIDKDITIKRIYVDGKGDNKIEEITKYKNKKWNR